MGLYYPYVHFRDERWLKLATLYWPRMARIVAPSYPTRDSELVRRLTGELGFVVNVSPATARNALVVPFTELISSLGPGALARWHVTREGPYEPDDLEPVTQIAAFEDRSGEAFRSTSTLFAHHTAGLHIGGPQIKELSGVHMTEVARPLRNSLIAADLARPVRDEWLGMHPELAWIYKCRLTEEIAQRNRLAATTDELAAHAVLSGDALPPTAIAGHAGALASNQGIATTFGLLAVTAVIPADLDDIPAEKFIEVRRRFGAQFDRWHHYVDRIGADLAEQLRDVESPEILSAYLDDAVRRYSTAQVEDLRQGLAAVGLDMVDQAMNSKFALPAGLAAGLATQPPLAAAAGIAAGAVAIRRAGHIKAQAKQMAPAAYLLSIGETLTPKSWVSRVMQAIRRTAGLRG